MKRKVFIFLITALFTFSAYGQDKSPVCIPSLATEEFTDYAELTPFPFYAGSRNPDKYALYQKKAKILKAIGWTSLGVGIPTMATGFFCAVATVYNGGNQKVWCGVCFTGVGLIIGSIPLFIYAHKNKQKALSLSVGSTSMTVPALNGAMQTEPVFALRIDF